MKRALTTMSLLLLTLVVPVAADEMPTRSGEEAMRRDPRLQRPVSVRVSRTPVAELLQRLTTELGVRLAAEGEDVQDQKVDLFTHGAAVSAAAILTALTDLLNAQCPPRGHRWDRSGPASNYRYLLVRDVASRQWEARQGSDAETRMARVLKERFAALGREPFREENAGRLELRSMRRLLPTLSEAQIERLCTERTLSLKPDDCTPGQRLLLRQLVRELVEDWRRRSPEETEKYLAASGPLEKFAGGGMGVLIRGETPRYVIEVSVDGPHPIGQLGYLGEAMDEMALNAGAPGAKPSALPDTPPTPDPVFALPPRTTWLMGDVLADIAARGRIHLIADDYTRDWSAIARRTGPRPLSAWLQSIRDEYGYVVTRRDGFVQLRNRVWWLEQKREVPLRLVRRWRQLLAGTNADRLRMLVEIAQRVPHSTHPRRIWDRMRLLEESPEMQWNVEQEGPGRSLLTLLNVVANRQVELLCYDRLPLAKQQAVLGSGLLLQWSDFPPALRDYFPRRFGEVEEAVAARDVRFFIRYAGDQLQLNWEYPFGSRQHRAELFIRPQPADDVRQLLGKPLPELDVEEGPTRTARFRLPGPALLYVTPAWPRPAISERAEFPDLRALARITDPRVHILATDATAAELRDWWAERGLAPPPPALTAASAQRLGVRRQPLALFVDGAGRVAWVKEGYTAGDEAEWERHTRLWPRRSPSDD